jgi:hypothetical protein
MIHTDRYIFEIPIYRCSPDQHTSLLAEEKRKSLQLFEVTRDTAPRSLAISKQWFDERHWYPWRYNETIGWLRLYALGAQIRAELWYVKARRIVRETRKRIFFVGKEFEISFRLADPNTEIGNVVLERLRDLKRQSHFRKRFIDLECFEAVAQHLDWKGLLSFPQSAAQPPAKIGRAARATARRSAAR